MLDNKETDGIELKEQMELFYTRCREANLRITPQRTTIYKALIESKDHPSAEMLRRKIRRNFPNISLDTINRTLLTLRDIGAAYVLEGSGDPKRFEVNLQTHQHFRCVKCRRIIDFRHKPFDNINIPAILSKQFTILRKTVYIEGICDKCRDKK